MANTFRLKRSATPGKVPQAVQLVPGELAVNTADGRLFAKLDSGAVVAYEGTPVGGQPAGARDRGQRYFFGQL
ncbi:hypothetical protein [Melaminivora sp.]|uniref:hypothetical protein n=1 Tax=Melaminivora sp. TaxID=1933032 RepID=UPI0028A7A1F3|nr:hypothetical protein [Melaminivora sp.]